MSDHRLYTGEDLLNLPPNTHTPLIENLLWEKDVVILAGKEKSGKSVFAQQMAFALSCGEPFLSEYKSKQISTIYIQLEGKLGQTQDRVNDMIEAVAWNKKNFNLIFYPGLEINTPEGLDEVIKMIDEAIVNSMPRPQLIIIDPLYMCIRGDLCNQVDASNTCKALRLIADKYDCALILVHHQHKAIRNMKTKAVIDEGDDSLFGSFIWKAFPDHIFMFKKVRKGHNELTCDTQRSSEVMEKLELNYIGRPAGHKGLYPLMYELRGDVAPYIQCVEANLSKEIEFTADEIAIKTKLSYSTIMKAFRALKEEKKLICVNNGHPKKWRLK